MAEERALHDDFRRVRPTLEGDLVRLRARELEDLERLNEMFDDPDVLAGLVVTFPQPLEGIREWYEGTRSLDDQVHFVIETLAGESMGICGLQNIEARARQALLGIWIGKPYWERGYGTDAIRVLCGFGFRQMNLQRITLHVYEPNERARHVYEKLGFKLEGTMRRAQFIGGRYVDDHVMGLLVEDFEP
ncbi:MAG: GNAT family N-acetyltransferase [Actinomycetota bacterium]